MHSPLIAGGTATRADMSQRSVWYVRCFRSEPQIHLGPGRGRGLASFFHEHQPPPERDQAQNDDGYEENSLATHKICQCHARNRILRLLAGSRLADPPERGEKGVSPISSA